MVHGWLAGALVSVAATMLVTFYAETQPVWPRPTMIVPGVFALCTLLALATALACATGAFGRRGRERGFGPMVVIVALGLSLVTRGGDLGRDQAWSPAAWPRGTPTGRPQKRWTFRRRTRLGLRTRGPPSI